MKKYIILIIFIISTKSSAYDDTSYLKTGLSYALEKINALVGTEDEVHAYGFNTAFGYRWINAEFYITSTIYFGKIEDLSFKAGNIDYTGSGNFRSVTIGPTYKYILPFKIFKNWNYYLSVGPHWSIQTIEFNNYTASISNGTNEFKLTYESFGTALGFGLEEQTLYKEMHPVFIEVIFIKRSTYKVSVVDTTNPAEVNIVTTSEADQDITEKVLLINLGITIF